MPATAAASRAATGSVPPATTGRPRRAPGARAIAASGPGMTVVARPPSPALAPFAEWIAYYDLRMSPDWASLSCPPPPCCWS